MSLVNQQNLLTKIYFPRLFIPTATVGGALVDMAIGGRRLRRSFCCSTGIMPSWRSCFLPLLILLTVMMALGVAYLLSALTVTYRDFRFLIPFITQIWMWLSFVVIPSCDRSRSAKWQVGARLQPDVFGIVAAFRSAARPS